MFVENLSLSQAIRESLGMLCLIFPANRPVWNRPWQSSVCADGCAVNVFFFDSFTFHFLQISRTIRPCRSVPFLEDEHDCEYECSVCIFLATHRQQLLPNCARSSHGIAVRVLGTSTRPSTMHDESTSLVSSSSSLAGGG